MTKLLCIEASPCMTRMLDALHDAGPMDAKTWAEASCTGEQTIRAYAAQLVSEGCIHIARVDMNHMGHKVVRIYGYGPGENATKERTRVIHKPKAEREFIPVPMIPRPCPITAALMRL